MFRSRASTSKKLFDSCRRQTISVLFQTIFMFGLICYTLEQNICVSCQVEFCDNFESTGLKCQKYLSLYLILAVDKQTSTRNSTQSRRCSLILINSACSVEPFPKRTPPIPRATKFNSVSFLRPPFKFTRYGCQFRNCRDEVSNNNDTDHSIRVCASWGFNFPKRRASIKCYRCRNVEVL